MSRIRAEEGTVPQQMAVLQQRRFQPLDIRFCIPALFVGLSIKRLFAVL
jgi:hypothetical protein